MGQKVHFHQTLRIATMRILRLAESWGLLASVQRVAVKAKPRSYRPMILRGAPCAGGKGSPGDLRKQKLGWDGAFNGIPHGSITLLAL
jgi:hypothetical protein